MCTNNFFFFFKLNYKKQMGEGHQKNELLTVEFGTLWHLFTRSFGEGEAFWTTAQTRRMLRPCPPCSPRAAVGRRGARVCYMFPFLISPAGLLLFHWEGHRVDSSFKKGPPLVGSPRCSTCPPAPPPAAPIQLITKPLQSDSGQMCWQEGQKWNTMEDCRRGDDTVHPHEITAPDPYRKQPPPTL